MVEKFLLEIPEQFESERLLLRSYRAGDGEWYYQMAVRNREHLRRYESGNMVFSVETPEQAEILVRDLHADWVGRKHFFIGLFTKTDGEFVGNIYLGVINWNLPEYVLGYFADVGHEGQGYISEAVSAVLKLAFGPMQAHRVRLMCSRSNARSIAVARRCGFSQEGLLRQEKRNPEGGFDDTLILGLLKDEFDRKG
jgi:ribosomal-protein-alanine N-acetyltransferase